ncbi:MAG: hypothetical protein EBT13_03600 [Rhodobacteraceae bacterium]|nr:hypothetical protein [Paracoccaceae bacterium]
MSGPVFPPIGPDWQQWARQLTAQLGRFAANLLWKTDDSIPAENGILLWDEVGKQVVVSLDGRWEPLMTGKKSAFGDTLISELHPIVNISGVYGLRDETETFTATGGSVTTAAADFVLQTGTSVGGYGVLWSKRPMVYIPGIGAEARITARFTSPVANSLQTCGMFSSINGMFFGYNGTSFGVMHRHSGALEIRTLTITTPSNTAATATVTLNGTAYTASVTNASATVNAEEIASGLRAGAAASAWNIQAISNTVVFQARGDGARSGTYSLAASAGPLAGTFAQDIAGVAKTEDWTPQADWNVDTCPWLDTTKGNIYKFEYAYLGYGPLKFSVFDPATRDFTLAHVVDWANANTHPNFNNPSMRVGWVSASLGSTTNLTVAGASGMMALQGRSGAWRPFGHSATAAGVTTETAVLALQSRYKFNNRTNAGIAHIKSISIATDSTKGAYFRIYKNPTFGGTPQWEYEDENQSIMLVDSAAASVSGVPVLATYVVGPTGSSTINLEELDIDMTAGDTFAITAEYVSGASAEMTASVTWGERV